MSNDNNVLSIRGLTVRYGDGKPAVDDLNIDLRDGETLAIVGESGSGKTTTANAVIGLLPPGAQIVSGEILVRGHRTSGVSERTLQRLRGTVVGLIPQDPTVSLNPTMRIGRQVGEAVRKRGDVNRRGLSAAVVELLERVELDDPVMRARQYPHELSGGMRQRVLIAMALAARPPLIIADEPTSALDVTTQRVVLDQLEELVRGSGSSLLIITHDLGVAGDRADRIVVMRHGRLVEEGRPAEVLVSPRTAYTRKLLDARPGLQEGKTVVTHADAPAPEGEPLLELDSISKDFTVRSVSGDRSLPAVSEVSLALWPGRTLAIVGESGSGKTTTLRIALGIETPSAGVVRFAGEQITGLSWRQLRPLRRRFQYVHQNPYASLDPRLRIRDTIIEPLVSFGVGSRGDREARAAELLDFVGLPQTFLERRPAELSGGQRQRVAIARALSVKPDLLLLDEPVSALDVSVQAQILELLRDLQQELGVAYVFVTHDLAVVAQVAHEVAVMQKGAVVESGTAEQVYTRPVHDYTRALLDAIPGQRYAHPHAVPLGEGAVGAGV